MNNLFLSLDIGNSNISISRSDTLEYVSLVENNKLHEILDLWMSQTEATLLYCCVISETDFESKFNAFFQFFNKLKKDPSHRILDINTLKKSNQFGGMPIQYSDTLGIDRMVQGYYVWKKSSVAKNTKPGSSMILSAGTMLTLNIIDPVQGFLGGHILQGLTCYMSAFQHAPKLPSKDLLLKKLMEAKSSIPLQIPQNTADAIVHGYIDTTQALIKEMVHRFNIKDLYCTGGQAKIWHQILIQNNLDSFFEPLLTHLSLWQIGNEIATMKP